MNKTDILDLVGIGIGPFNLSLAALIYPVEGIRAKFLDMKPSFSWHPELIFDGATMQTSYLKDLVTPVDPTSSFSFLNYITKKGQFYHFLNTNRGAITRIEFQDYLSWVSHELEEILCFDRAVSNVSLDNDHFLIDNGFEKIHAKNICIASGPERNIPKCVKGLIGSKVFHAKSKEIEKVDLSNKRVLIVGGGQTGVETFRNILKGRWGSAKDVHLISGRENLRPLDEGAFTNEIFTPEFVEGFHSLDQNIKDNYTKSLLLTSDGNTPNYLQELYNELYMDRFYLKRFPKYRISPMRWLSEVHDHGQSYLAGIKNLFDGKNEIYEADIIILATGFTSRLPDYLNGIKDLIDFDDQGRLIIDENYKIKGRFNGCHIYAMNYSRHGHGVADPQTSLMSWRSAKIINNLKEEKIYLQNESQSSFINFFNS